MGGLFQLFGEEAGISGNWATTHSLTFHGCPWTCPGTGWCVFSRANVLQWVYTWLTVPWKQNLPAILDPVDSNQSLSCPMTCHSFKGCALFPPVSLPWGSVWRICQNGVLGTLLWMSVSIDIAFMLVTSPAFQRGSLQSSIGLNRYVSLFLEQSANKPPLQNLP